MIVEALVLPLSGLPPSYISVRNAAGSTNISLLTGGVVVGTQECHCGLWLAVAISSRCRGLVRDTGGRSPDAVLVVTWAGGGGMPLWLLGRGSALSPRWHRTLVRRAGVFRPDTVRWWGRGHGRHCRSIGCGWRQRCVIARSHHFDAARGVGCGEEVGVQGAPWHGVWPCVIGAAMLCHDEHASLIRCSVVVCGIRMFV